MTYLQALGLVALGGAFLFLAVSLLNSGRALHQLTRPSADDLASREHAEAALEESRAARARAAEQTREYREVVERLQHAVDQLVNVTKEIENR